MRNIIAEIIFWLHFVIVAFLIGLFFVPESWWPGKISFHFFLTLIVAGHQIVWGGIMTYWSKKYGMVCILTTAMQLVRGKKMSEESNYRHSFVQEFFERFNIPLAKQGPFIITLIILFTVTIQYFFFR